MFVTKIFNLFNVYCRHCIISRYLNYESRLPLLELHFILDLTFYSRSGKFKHAHWLNNDSEIIYSGMHTDCMTKKSVWYNGMYCLTRIGKFGNFWDRFTGKPIQTKCYISCMVSVKNRMNEFSSKLACVTTRKMKISEKFLDKFSMICQ